MSIDRDLVDNIIGKLSRGYASVAIAKTKNVPDKNLHDLGALIIEGVLNLAKCSGEPELLKYTINEIITKAPNSVNKLAEIVKAKHPDQVEHLEKLILLV